MNRRSFVGGALAGLGGLLFPQKSETKVSKGLTHNEMLQLISQWRDVGFGRFYSYSTNRVVKYSSKELSSKLTDVDVRFINGWGKQDDGEYKLYCYCKEGNYWLGVHKDKNGRWIKG